MTDNTTTALDANREQWLTAAADMIAQDHIQAHAPDWDRPYRVSVGFPANTRAGSALGQCWAAAASADGSNEIFMSPTCTDSMAMLETLVHELIHAADDCQSGHKGFFAKTAKAVGLVGKMTATLAGDDLREYLGGLIDLLGPIPHAPVDPTLSGKKKQGTRMIKLECDLCEWHCRTSQKNIDLLPDNAPCPCCGEGTLAADV